MSEISIAISIIMLFYIYIGYPVVVITLGWVCHKYRKKYDDTVVDDLLTISVIVSAHNEENVIVNRIKNLYNTDYPQEKIEIIIGSDGSNDETVKKIEKYKKKGIIVRDFKENRGRALVHNDCVKEAQGQILIFSDAETLFDKKFLMNITRAFKYKRVGCVVGDLSYINTSNAVSQSEGMYFSIEKKIRKAESRLGLLFTGSGACLAVRRKLWRDLLPEDDCDYITPLDILLQGFCVVFQSRALAYDKAPNTAACEIKVRIRQTAKNLHGTIRRWGIRGFVRHPLLSWAILSHKILRWLTPFFMMIIFFSNYLMIEYNSIYKTLFWLQITFYLLAIIGAISDKVSYSIPIAKTIYSFCLACIGMLIGVLKAMAGRVPYSYKKNI